MEEGGSSKLFLIGDVQKKLRLSSQGSRASASSSSSCKDFLRQFVDSEILTEALLDWFSQIYKPGSRESAFNIPFELTELQSFDYALEGVRFQQLIRMPNALYATTSESIEATAHLAIEDFLHAGVKGLWETFWGHDDPLPFTVASIHSTSSKFYPAEKAIASGKLEGLCATAILLKNNRHSHGKWDQIVQLALLRPDIGNLSLESGQRPSVPLLGEAFFFAIRVLLARSLSRSNSVLRNSNCVFILLVDSQHGAVVRFEGDVSMLEFDLTNVYESAAKWIREYATITVSPVHQVWNKLGNANWGDIGTLQLLLASFYCMVQICGMPRYSLEDLADEHGSRLHVRRTERQLADMPVKGIGLFRLQRQSHSPEIVEVHEETARLETQESLKLEKGSIMWIEDSNLQKGFEIIEAINDSESPIYSATPVDEPGKAFLLYVGSAHLESALEDMNLWYQVQRQTKILNLMKERGLSSKYLPQMVASGRLVHPGECNKTSSAGNCGHPWCGTPILVMSPLGETVANLMRNGLFGPDQALKCCHDCLSAIQTASLAGIKHGDIRPENLIFVRDRTRHPFFVLIGWGHAVIEDRDRPSVNLLFSSTYALQEGKLCASSDAENLIYLLYFLCGGEFPELDSVEGVLQWRDVSWSRRIIQQKLGDVSAVLKAFADYVDGMCGTPYSLDYEIWLRRLRRMINGDHEKEIEVPK